MEVPFFFFYFAFSKRLLLCILKKDIDSVWRIGL